MELAGYDGGQCEVCDEVVEERDLLQCQLGFCGTFLCSLCAQYCSSCRNGNNTGSSFMAFCSPCSNKVTPNCFNCKTRFCGRCTSFTKCKLCSNWLCSKCLLQDESQLLTDGRCKSCIEKQKIKSLETICRNAIREYIAGNLSNMRSNQIGNACDRIDYMIDQLSLPITVAEKIKSCF